MAQTAEITDFSPLSVRNAGYASWEAFLVAEGEPWSFSGNGSATPAAGAVNVSVASSGTIPQIGKVAYVEQVTASLSEKCLAQVQHTADGGGAGKFPNWLQFFIASPGGAVTFAMRSLFRGYALGSNSSIAVSVRRMLSASPGTDVIYGGVSACGSLITDDLDYAAPIVALFIGNSIIAGTGPTKTANMWPFLVKAYLRSIGIRARVVLKSISGTQSTDHEGYRAAGYHDIARADLIFYDPAANDAAQAISDATYVANLTAMWTWVSKRYPNATMFVMGPTPLENNTWETRAVALRLAGAAYVAGVANPKLRFIDQGSAFDRTVSSNYASSDSAGSRIHPNDTGHAAVAAVINTALATFDLSAYVR